MSSNSDMAKFLIAPDVPLNGREDWPQPQQPASPPQSSSQPVFFAVDYMAGFTSQSGMPSWIFDSGCSYHMTNDPSLLTTTDNVQVFPTIRTASGQSLSFTHCGSITPRTDLTGRLTLEPVLVSPGANLISISALASSGLDVLFSSTFCVVQDRHTGKVHGTGRRDGSLYYLEYLHIPLTHGAFATTTPPTTTTSTDLWHQRLGHLSFGRLQRLISTGVLGNVSSGHESCTVCKLAKFSAQSFSSNSSVSEKPFDLVHSDVWGPSPTSSQFGYLYYIIFVDDFSLYTWVYLLKTRVKVFSVYQQFTSMILTQFGAKIKIFRLDCAKEYLSSDMRTQLRFRAFLL